MKKDKEKKKKNKKDYPKPEQIPGKIRQGRVPPEQKRRVPMPQHRG